MTDTITIPVEARMVKQPDGSFKMVQATYITTSAAELARFLVERLGIPAKEAAN